MLPSRMAQPNVLGILNSTKMSPNGVASTGQTRAELLVVDLNRGDRTTIMATGPLGAINGTRPGLAAEEQREKRIGTISSDQRTRRPVSRLSSFACGSTSWVSSTSLKSSIANTTAYQHSHSSASLSPSSPVTQTNSLTDLDTADRSFVSTCPDRHNNIASATYFPTFHGYLRLSATCIPAGHASVHIGFRYLIRLTILVLLAFLRTNCICLEYNMIMPWITVWMSPRQQRGDHYTWKETGGAVYTQ
jgi:hypothetical protein